LFFFFWRIWAAMLALPSIDERGKWTCAIGMDVKLNCKALCMIVLSQISRTSPHGNWIPRLRTFTIATMKRSMVWKNRLVVNYTVNISNCFASILFCASQYHANRYLNFTPANTVDVQRRDVSHGPRKARNYFENDINSKCSIYIGQTDLKLVSTQCNCREGTPWRPRVAQRLSHFIWGRVAQRLSHFSWGKSTSVSILGDRQSKTERYIGVDCKLWPTVVDTRC
jgi:hypothetical protein